MAILPNTVRINHKPDILYGLDGTEVVIIFLLSTLLGLMCGVVTAIVLQQSGLFLLFTAMWGFVFGIATGRWLRGQKRQKPPGYYFQRMIRWMNSPKYELIMQSHSFDYLRH